MKAGYYYRGATEHVLFAVKGKLRLAGGQHPPLSFRLVCLIALSRNGSTGWLNNKAPVLTWKCSHAPADSAGIPWGNDV
jgi:hypothetical protein